MPDDSANQRRATPEVAALPVDQRVEAPAATTETPADPNLMVSRGP